MEIKKGQKLLAKKTSGTSYVEITRHPDPIMDNILVVNRIGRNKEHSWIIEKDIETWLNHLRSEGYSEIKILDDVDNKISKKNNKNK